VILTAFPRQKWLRERASLLRLYLHLGAIYRRKSVYGKMCFFLSFISVSLSRHLRKRHCNKRSCQYWSGNS